MTYIVGGNIQASDYNAFATLANGMNELFADTHAGTTTLPNAGYGYGQSSILPVSVGSNILASEWNSLFTAMRSSGLHQGTLVTPPIPASGPVSGNNIAAIASGTAVSNLIVLLKTNKFNVALGQTSLYTGTAYPSSGSWSSSLVYTTKVNFGSWNNARYFFNAGGNVLINGAYTGGTGSPIETAWANQLTEMSPLKFNYTTTTQNAGGNATASPAGFYGLTTAYQDIYKKFLTAGGGAYYGSSYILVRAKLSNAPGTNGEIDFAISLIDGDSYPVAKTGTTTYTLSSLRSAAPVAYPGTFAVTSGGFAAT
jgi:hypothetical protein